MEYIKDCWLQLRNIDVIKGESYILNKINLNLYKGEIVTILGPNGSGKSTLINLIAKNIYPKFKDDSRFLIYGKENINIWDLRKKISFVNRDLHERMDNGLTVKELVGSGIYGSIGLTKGQLFTDDDEHSINNIMNIFDLESFQSSKYKELSDGQRRSVLIARAIISNPEVLVLDEPLINLDFKAYYRLVELLNKLTSTGISMLMATNKIENILKDTNKLILLKNGRIYQNGDPNKILNVSTLKELFGIEMKILKSNGYWRSVPI